MSVRVQSILKERPHQSAQYSYKRFLSSVVPSLQAIEAKSKDMEFYFVFVNTMSQDFYDLWGRTYTILPLLRSYADRADLALEELFTDVYVYSHSLDAHIQVIDSLLQQGYHDLAAGKRNLNRALRDAKDRRVLFDLGVLETLQNPQRHEELLKPRESALEAVATLRDPATASRIARTASAMRGNTPNAQAIIGNLTRKESQQARAQTARNVRNRIRNTVRKTPRLPKNITRGVLYEYLAPNNKTKKNPVSTRMRNSLTANVPPMRIQTLFPE